VILGQVLTSGMPLRAASFLTSDIVPALSGFGCPRPDGAGAEPDPGTRSDPTQRSANLIGPIHTINFSQESRFSKLDVVAAPPGAARDQRVTVLVRTGTIEFTSAACCPKAARLQLQVADQAALSAEPTNRHSEFGGEDASDS
jgi:hypothetical protein